jgi:hypothetical protein
VATPIIQSVGSSSGAGVAGQGRNDLVAGETVTLSDAEGANAGHVYLWEFEDVPLGTSPSMTGPATATPHFVVNADPALAGSYRVKCTVDGIDRSVEVLAKPLTTTGGRIPSFQEQLEYDGGGNAKGWHEAMTGNLRGVDSRIPQIGSTIITRLPIGGRESHNSDTPLVVGAISFSPDTYDLDNATTQIYFVVHAANGTTPLTTHAILYNVTDGEVVASSAVNVVDDTTLARYSPLLVVGVAAGTIKTGSERIYECRIYLDVAPGDPAVDTIELFEAELKVVQTIT